MAAETAACFTAYSSPSLASGRTMAPYANGSAFTGHCVNGSAGYVPNDVANGAASGKAGSFTSSPPYNTSGAPATSAAAKGHQEVAHANVSKIAGSAGSQAPGNQVNGQSPTHVDMPQEVRRPTLWYEEEIDENLRWCFGLVSILHTGVSKFQEIALLDTKPFGKVLTLDRKMQSAEMDEWVYHECLVHPSLLLHASPRSVFIMGGGEGSTAREALRHRSVQTVVMCDIDEEVVKFCSAHLTMNKEAFRSSKLELVINDARAELESREERFDVVVGDLADPMEGGPCYQLYSRNFYEMIVKPKLNQGGIFVTQAGPAGVLSHKEVFTSIFNTLRHVFAHVMAYAAHVPSYADTWGWVMASDQEFPQLSNEQLDALIKQRIKGELRYLDGATLHASTVLNKAVRQRYGTFMALIGHRIFCGCVQDLSLFGSLLSETHVYTEDSARFVYGHGRSMLN